MLFCYGNFVVIKYNPDIFGKKFKEILGFDFEAGEKKEDKKEGSKKQIKNTSTN